MSHIFNNAEPGSQLIWTVMLSAIARIRSQCLKKRGVR